MKKGSFLGTAKIMEIWLVLCTHAFFGTKIHTEGSTQPFFFEIFGGGLSHQPAQNYHFWRHLAAPV
jgi:hypothetical protein